MIEDKGRSSTSAMALRALAFLVLTMLAATVIVAQQRGSGAYLAELSANDLEEARHFVTGLMMADWASAGFPPLSAFAADHGLHFPMAAGGARFSLYYVAEGAWTGLVGATTPAALLLPALLAAVLVVSAGWAATLGAGALAGVAAGFVLCALPLLRQATIVIGLDLPLALLGLLSALAFARYARRETRGDALLFTVCGMACILTAPAGAAVLVLPPLAVVLAGRLALLRRASFWVPVAALLAAAVFAGGRPASAASAPEALRASFAALASAAGMLPFTLAGFGALFAIRAGWRREEAGDVMAAVAALAFAWAAALAVGLAGGPMAVLPLLAPVVMLAAYGAMGLLGLLISGWTIVSGLIVAVVLLLAAMPALLQPIHKGIIGMDDAAQAFLARDAAPPVLVVAADPKGEAALVAAMAQRDRAWRSFVVPAGRLAARDAGAFLAAIDAIGATGLVLEETSAAPAQGPDAAAAAAVAAFPGRFRLVGTFPRADGAGMVRLYAVDGRGPAPSDPAAAIRRLAPAPAS